jgi:hypothetical protein
VGDIAGIVRARSAPLGTEALSTWWANQRKILQEGIEFEAIQTALGIVAIAATSRKTQIPPGVIASLLVRLTGSAPMAHAAAEALAYINNVLDSSWKPDIKDTDQFVSFISVSTNDPEAVRFLVWILDHEKVGAAVDPLITWSNHPSSELRQTATRALGNMGSERAVEPLIARLEDTDADVRYAAAEALGNMGSERAVEPLIARLEDTDADVRYAAARVLGNMGSERAVEPLIARLEHADADVRYAAAEALGNMGSERAVEPLIARLEDTDADVRRAAVKALSRRVEQEDRYLLSRDFDGINPFLDPRETISVAWVNKATRIVTVHGGA